MPKLMRLSWNLCMQDQAGAWYDVAGDGCIDPENPFSDIDQELNDQHITEELLWAFFQIAQGNLGHYKLAIKKDATPYFPLHYPMPSINTLKTQAANTLVKPLSKTWLYQDALDHVSLPQWVCSGDGLAWLASKSNMPDQHHPDLCWGDGALTHNSRSCSAHERLRAASKRATLRLDTFSLKLTPTGMYE